MINEIEIVIRLVVALALGAVVGIEREREAQNAGLRTHMILVLGSCLAMILSINIASDYGSDPARLAAQVISGIGFLGAGAILRFGFNVRGLTTATTIWSMAIVGMAVGYGYYIVGVVVTLLILMTLTLVSRVARKYVRKGEQHEVTIDMDDRPGTIRKVQKLLQSSTEETSTFSLKKNVRASVLRMEIQVIIPQGERLEELIDNISKIEGVRTIKIS